MFKGFVIFATTSGADKRETELSVNLTDLRSQFTVLVSKLFITDKFFTVKLSVDTKEGIVKLPEATIFPDTSK